ncbi:CPBP family intramembrane glutamic endopeptidase [Salinirussus salinus]|uniref:CPBP family intramembrane glutamic endopeptidase n=1 Tax=Salinirussus salinus TaxID=1198300 RepID=UPI00135CEE08|nr:CPBP family intramembrane glutamic endopeptidase [Salinirussus salinus]
MGRDGGSPLRSLAVYTCLTYAVSWTSWGLWGMLPAGPSALGTVLFVLGGLGPFLVGVALTYRSRRQVRSWLAAIFRIQVPVRYYAAALALPVAVILVAGAVHTVVFDGGLTLEALPGSYEYPLFLGFILLFGGGLEEPGWRGYLLPQLQRRYSALVAALVVGVVWAGWHLPLFVLPGTVQSQMSLVLYLSQILAMSVVLTWLTNAVGGSVVPAVLLHAGGNAVLNYYPVGGVAGATSALGLGLLVATLLGVASLLVVAYGPSDLAPHPT